MTTLKPLHLAADARRALVAQYGEAVVSGAEALANDEIRRAVLGDSAAAEPKGILHAPLSPCAP